MLTLRNTVNEISSSSGVQFRVANEGTVAQQAYVGIVAMYGTPSPKFVVKVNTGTASYAEYLSIAPDGLTTVNALTVAGSLSVGGTIRASDTGGLRVVDSGGTLGVYVKDSGDVGIGTATTTSGHKLTVNGKIDATGATLDSADVTGDIRLTGSLAGDVSGTERSWRQTQYYSTNIATGATDTVATFTLPGNAKCGGVVTLAISQDTTAGTQRGHMLHIRLYVETFSSSFGVINSATISSHSATNEPLPTVAFAAGSGTTLNINVTNNGASKVIRNVAVTLDITRAN